MGSSAVDGPFPREEDDERQHDGDDEREPERLPDDRVVNAPAESGHEGVREPSVVLDGGDRDQEQRRPQGQPCLR